MTTAIRTAVLCVTLLSGVTSAVAAQETPAETAETADRRNNQIFDLQRQLEADIEAAGCQLASEQAVKRIFMRFLLSEAYASDLPLDLARPKLAVRFAPAAASDPLVQAVLSTQSCPPEEGGQPLLSNVDSYPSLPWYACLTIDAPTDQPRLILTRVSRPLPPLSAIGKTAPVDTPLLQITLSMPVRNPLADSQVTETLVHDIAADLEAAMMVQSKAVQ